MAERLCAHEPCPCEPERGAKASDVLTAGDAVTGAANGVGVNGVNGGDASARGARRLEGDRPSGAAERLVQQARGGLDDRSCVARPVDQHRRRNVGPGIGAWIAERRTTAQAATMCGTVWW